MPIFAQMIDSISTSASSVATTPTLANLSLAAIDPRMTNILIGLFLVVSITMILLVLIQRPSQKAALGCEASCVRICTGRSLNV